MKSLKRITSAFIAAAMLFTFISTAAAEPPEPPPEPSGGALTLNEVRKDSLAADGAVNRYTFTLPTDGQVTMLFERPIVTSGEPAWKITMDDGKGKDFFFWNTREKQNRDHLLLFGDETSSKDYIGYLPAGTYNLNVGQGWSGDHWFRGNEYELTISFVPNEGAFEIEDNDTPETATVIYLDGEAIEPDPLPEKMTFGRMGETALDWDIVEVDEENNKMLLRSDRVIENREVTDAERERVWADSDLRKYLNGVFLANFNTMERELILETQISNESDNQDETMTDKFFLSVEEDVARYREDGGVRPSVWITVPREPQRGAGSIIGNLNHHHDVDYFTFELPVTGEVSIQFETEDTGKHGSFWSIEMVNFDNREDILLSEEVTGDDFFDATQLGTDEHIGFLPAGTYLIKIAVGWGGAYWHRNYDYILSVSYVERIATLQSGLIEDEPNDTPEEATPLPLNETITGNLYHYTDVDWYTFTLTRKSSVWVHFMRENLERNGELWGMTVYAERLDDKGEKILVPMWFSFQENPADYDHQQLHAFGNKT
ncbi:MAG: DUF6273 domain-containing protein, partial [Oscillospiraceae bacterium]|nr:DUF6273 domain-containing protein [Oscillospiraceae bacterium]